MADFAVIAADMEPGLRDRYLAWSPRVAAEVRTLIPEECSSQWLSDTCSPLVGDWETEAVHPICFLPASRYVERGGKQIRPLLAGLVLDAYGYDPKEYFGSLAMVEGFHILSLLATELVWKFPECRGGESAIRTYGIVRVAFTHFAMRYYLFGLLRQNPYHFTPAVLRSLFEDCLGEGLGTALHHGPNLTLWEGDGLSGVERYRLSSRSTFRLAGAIGCSLALPQNSGDRAGVIRYAEALESVYRLRGEALAFEQGKAFRDWTPTFALVHAADQLHDPDRGRLKQLLETAVGGDAAARAQVATMVAECGGTAATQAELDRSIAAASQALGSMPLGAESRRLFTALVGYAAHRTC